MNKAYNPTTWHNLPSTLSPIDETNLNLLSQGLSTVDDRVVVLDTTVQDSVHRLTVDEQTGEITVYKNDGSSYSYNPVSRVYTALNTEIQQTQRSFADVSSNFASVQELLADMDAKVDLTAAGANAGIENLRTTITQNDGYYRQEMSGIRTYAENIGATAAGLNDTTNQRLTYFQSSITQTTEAIQLSVSQLTTDMGEEIEALQSQITVQAGEIDMKVTKRQIINGLAEEFGSGIQITPNRITIASTGALVINTTNFKLDQQGNAEFTGTVFMQDGYVGGYPILTTNDGVSSSAAGHAHHAWKLRSAASGPTDLRLYAYITANKNFIVTTSEDSGHREENDATDRCSVGSYKYPWAKGYFDLLRVQRHNVIPEGINITLAANGWTQHSSGYYTQTIDVNGMSGDLYLYIATNNATNLDYVYKWNIEVDTVQQDKVIFLANAQPTADVSLVLLVEDFIYSRMDGAELNGSFNSDLNQLSCLWSSPSDSSKFITWLSDELVIEECIDEEHESDPSSWREVLVVPGTGETPFTEDEFEDSPLIIGSENDD